MLPKANPYRNLGVKCRFPGCPNYAEHLHHVQYAADYFYGDVIEPLCSDHHQEITNLNGIHARRHHRKLSPKYRWWIWYQWLEGKLKPRNTRRCREWWEPEKLEAERKQWRELSPDEREKRNIEVLLGQKFNTVEEARAERWKQGEAWVAPHRPESSAATPAPKARRRERTVKRKKDRTTGKRKKDRTVKLDKKRDIKPKKAKTKRRRS